MFLVTQYSVQHVKCNIYTCDNYYVHCNIQLIKCYVAIIAEQYVLVTSRMKH